MEDGVLRATPSSWDTVCGRLIIWGRETMMPGVERSGWEGAARDHGFTNQTDWSGWLPFIVKYGKPELLLQWFSNFSVPGRSAEQLVKMWLMEMTPGNFS